MQRGVCEYGIVPVERLSSAAGGRLEELNLSENQDGGPGRLQRFVRHGGERPQLFNEHAEGAVQLRKGAVARPARCRLPRLPGGASSKSTGSLPPQARAARDHTSPTRRSTRTRRYGKLRSGKTSAPERRRPRRAPAGSGT